MTTQAIITCVILVITMVLLISQKVPLVILGAAIPAALAATGVINAGSAYTEFGNTTIVFFMGLVVVGEAFFKTGLADFIGGKIIGLLGKTEKGLLLGTGLVAGGLSAFLNDTGSTACLMPIVSSMASKAGVKKSKLLMALAFFASLGGTITLVGTTPHIVANGILKDMGLREFGFFEYTKIGLPLLVCGILYMCFCGTKLLPDKDIEIKGGDRTAEYDTKKMVLVALIFIGVLVAMATSIVPMHIAGVIGVLVAMATSIVPMHIAGVIGAILVVVTGCISLEEAIKAFPTSTIFIVGGIFPLSKALVSSGAAEYLVNAISPVLSNLPPIVLLGAITFLMLLTTQFLMNSSATVLVLPIAIMLCQAAGINPLAGAMSVSVCASGAFVTPFGTAPNLLVWEAGGYSVKDYLKCGFPMLIIFGVVTTALCAVFYL